MPHVAEPEHLPVAAARAGDRAAWRVLFQRYQLPLYAYVFAIVRNEQASLDIVQEAFIRAVRHLGGLREDGKFGGWLFGIAHQQCISHWRRTGRENFFDDNFVDEPVDDGPGPAEALLQVEQAAEFRERIAQLPPAQRAVLILFYLEDFSLEEIARVTGAPVGTVKSRMHHAKRAMKKLYEERT